MYQCKSPLLSFSHIYNLTFFTLCCLQPKKDIPAGLFKGIMTLVCCAIGLVFIATQSPGPQALASEYLPMTSGFAKMFNIPYYSHAIWLSLPAIYANFYGHVWAYGRQMSQMAKSGLLPIQLTWMSPWTDTPYVASICGTLMAFLNALCAYYNVFYISFASDLVDIAIMCSYLVFMGLFLS